MIKLPALPGAYVLEFYLPQAIELVDWASGQDALPGGSRISTWAAPAVPGGLKARSAATSSLAKLIVRTGISITCTGSPRCSLQLIWFNRIPRSATPLECRWSQALAELPGACVPLPGFGASDCRLGCPAHLVVFAGEENDNHPLLGRSGWLRLPRTQRACRWLAYGYLGKHR